MIPYGRHDISEEDIEAVVEVLRSDWLTQGPTVSHFEKAFAEYCNASHALAVNSATSALHIACLALGLGPGDWLWTSPITFVASANCARYCNAFVDFVDIDPKTENMSVDSLEQKLERADVEGRLPKIVVAVHFAGRSCEMGAIHDLATRYGFHVIEDASHALGGQYLGQAIGSCRYSDITIFSLHPVKIITTGEGGIATTNCDELAYRMRQLRSHGITRDPNQMEWEPDGPWCYQQVTLGFNFRMTDIQAALGLSQLSRLDQFVARRRRLSAIYREKMSEMPLVLPSADNEAAWHLYVVRLDEEFDRGRVFEALRLRNIGVNVHYIPVHFHPYYQRLGFKRGDFPVAEQYYKCALTLPLFSSMSEEQQDYVIASLSWVLLRT